MTERATKTSSLRFGVSWKKQLKLVLTVACPDCGFAAGESCEPRCPGGRRFTLVSGHPALSVTCPTPACSAAPGQLCRNLRTKKLKFNVDFHAERDFLAYNRRDKSKDVRGLFYEDGQSVNVAWLGFEVIKRPKIHVVGVRGVGMTMRSTALMAASFDNRRWFASRYTAAAVELALANKPTIVEEIADLSFDDEPNAFTMWPDGKKTRAP